MIVVRILSAVVRTLSVGVVETESVIVVQSESVVVVQTERVAEVDGYIPARAKVDGFSFARSEVRHKVILTSHKDSLMKRRTKGLSTGELNVLVRELKVQLTWFLYESLKAFEVQVLPIIPTAGGFSASDLGLLRKGK